MTMHNVTERLHVEDCNLAGSRFSNVNLGGASFDNVNLSDGSLHDVNLARANITDANLADVSINRSTMVGMRVDGVLVSDLIAAYRAQARSGQAPDKTVRNE